MAEEIEMARGAKTPIRIRPLQLEYDKLLNTES